MKKLLPFVTLIIAISILSCTKESATENSLYKEDSNNYFTATFSGKTLKTTGYIFNNNGVTDDLSGSLTLMNALLNTSNINATVSTDLYCSVNGSISNLSLAPLYKIPLQKLDAFLMLERTGNAVGTYKIYDLGVSGYYSSNITDLTVGKKKYDLDPSTTTVTVTAADLLTVQGTYTGNLIDGSTKIPVTGSFKLRKI